jgi:hypothetical protein
MNGTPVTATFLSDKASIEGNTGEQLRTSLTYTSYVLRIADVTVYINGLGMIWIRGIQLAQIRILAFLMNSDLNFGPGLLVNS